MRYTAPAMATNQEFVEARVPLGEIRVGAFIGRGGFGSVHEASISGVAVLFAINVLDPSPFARNPEAARARFFQEADLLFRLRHPHIIAIYGVGEHEGRPFILMERFKGRDLNRARERQAPSAEKVLPFIERVAMAVGYAHSQGVVHRDIKPANLMAARGDARVLDFGIATALDPDGARLTRTGDTCVGDAYSAPELIESPRLTDPRCDVFSLGACWFWLLTGRAPKGLNFEQALRSSVKVSTDYERVLLRCLDQPEARYPSMDELAVDLQALKSGDTPAAGRESPNEDDTLVFAIIANACPEDSDSIIFYRIEQELAGAMRRLSLTVSIGRLLRIGLIERFSSNGTQYRVTRDGSAWMEAHERQLDAVLTAHESRVAASQARQTRGDAEVDVPF